MGNCSRNNIENNDNVVVMDAKTLQTVFNQYHPTDKLNELLNYIPVNYNYVILPNKSVKIKKSSKKTVHPMYYHMDLKFDFYDCSTITVTKEYKQKLDDFCQNTKPNKTIITEHYDIEPK